MKKIVEKVHPSYSKEIGKSKSFWILLIIAGIALAVGTERLKRIIERTTEKSISVNIDFGAGTLKLSKASAGKIVEASLEYDPDKVKPRINYDLMGTKGKLQVDMKSPYRKDDGINFNYPDLKKNDWDLKLSTEIPLTLDLDLGASKSDLDFSGMQITDCKISTGASETSLRFDTPNPVRMSLLKIEAGIAKFRASNLANANFDRFKFDGGVGSYTLDFRGELNHRTDIAIEVGLGSTTILIPKRFGVKLISDGSFLSSVSFDRMQKIRSDVYVNDQYGKTESELVINLDTGIGSVNLEWVE